MRLGQPVMLIANHGLIDRGPPPIGAVGEITGLMDDDGDYFVLFAEHPCSIGEPDWFVPAPYLIPIEAVKDDEPQEFYCEATP